METNENNTQQPIPQQTEQVNQPQTLEFEKIQKSVEELTDLRDELLQKQKAQKEAEENAKQSELEKEGNELKKIMSEISELKKELEDVKGFKSKIETEKVISAKFNELTKGLNIDISELKSLIRYDNIQSVEELQTVIESAKKILIKNGNPLALGTADPQATKKKYTEELNKIIERQNINKQ